jgi:DNA sulfur modification protein DndB
MSNIILKGSIDTIDSLNSKGLMSTQMTIREVLGKYRLDKDVNRDLSYNRLPDLIKYFEKAETDLGIYLPALVFSFRENPVHYYDNKNGTLEVNEASKLVVIDGQHRIKAMEKYVEKSKDKKNAEAFLENVVTVQVYFGLGEADERKLFADINSNSKRVSMSLITQYDSRDIMNLLIQEIYRSSNALRLAEIELNKSKVIRPTNKAFSTGARLKYFISYLLFGKKSPSKKDEQILKAQYDEIISFLNKFFTVFFNTIPGTPGDVLKYVLGHEPIQNAIAIYLNQALIIQDNEAIGWIDDWETEVEQLDSIDWSIKNNEWNGWFITVNPVKGSYKGFVETVTPEIVNFIESKVG